MDLWSLVPRPKQNDPLLTHFLPHEFISKTILILSLIHLLVHENIGKSKYILVLYMYGLTNQTKIKMDLWFRLTKTKERERRRWWCLYEYNSNHQSYLGPYTRNPNKPTAKLDLITLNHQLEVEFGDLSDDGDVRDSR